MDFHTSVVAPPKNLFPCLLTLTTGQQGSRRSSFTLGVGGAEDGGAIRRSISGGRRKSSFGTASASKDEAAAAVHAAPGNGPWYWRVQAGVNEADGTLVLLALSNPPNPVLTSPPGPLSAAMPSHAVHKDEGAHAHAHAHAHDDGKPGFTDRVKNIFRRSSVNPDTKAGHDGAQPDAAAATETGTATAAGTDADPAGAAGMSDAAHAAAGAGTADTGAAAAAAPRDVILDQNAAGDPVPSPSTTVTSDQAHAGQGTATAEQGWPGVINGERLVAITVPLGAIDRTRFTLKGGKKNEATWLNVVVTSSIVGKAGTLRLEFDKDWIGAKAEAEVLYHSIERLISEPAGSDKRFEGKPQGDAPYNEDWQDKVRGKW